MKKPLAQAVIIITQVVVLALLAWVVWLVNHPVSKVAVVRTAFLVDNYEGIKEARALLSQRAWEWNNNLDSLRSDLKNAVEKSQLSVEAYSNMEDSELPEEIVFHKTNLERYAKVIKEKAASEEEELIQGALNQVNSFVERYAKEQGYDLVVGLLPAGNILYAEEAIDITDEVLLEINRTYRRKGD